MNRVLYWGILAGIGMLSGAGLARAEVNVKTGVPALIQLDFGPYGSRLPGDGNAYCYPTSATMLLFWLHDNGFSQIAAPFSNPAALDLDRAIAGLFETSPTGGTTNAQYQAGLTDYLNAKGISSALITWDVSNNPSMEWFNDHNGPNSVVLAGLSWYSRDGDTDYFSYAGGHGTALIAADPTTQKLTVNNPYPSTFFNVQNVPANGELTVDVLPVPNTWTLEYDTTPPYIQILTPIVGPGNAGNQNTYAVYDTGIALTLADAAKPTDGSYALAAWTLNSSKSLNTNGGFLSVLAPLDGAGGIHKLGEGELQLQNTNQLTGANLINGGTLSSTSSSATPFGTGEMTIVAGTLAFKPDATGPADLELTLAAGSGNQLHLEGGAQMRIDRGTHDHWTLTIGGNGDGSTANLLFANRGTLTLAVAGGLDELGNQVKVKLAGSSGNLPPLTNGIVSPAIVGQETNSSGAFLTYDANGFQKAATTSGDLNSANASTVYQATANQTLTSNAAVYALAVNAGVTITGPFALAVGPLLSGDAGIVLNGGQVNSAIQYGAANAKVYVSQSGGTLGGSLTGSGTFVQFGPGTLTLSGDSSATQTGDIQVNSGTLHVASTGRTGSGNLNLLKNVRLEVAGTVGGMLLATDTSEVILQSGSLEGGLTLGADASLRGNGTINGTSALSGSIYAGVSTPGILTFGGPTSFVDGSMFFWRLANLTDNTSGGIAGSDWNAFAFTDTANFGSDNNALTLYMDIPSAWDPNSANPFWDINHVWTLATAPTGTFTDANYNPSVETWSWLDGTFYVSRTDDQSTILLHYVSTIPEPRTSLLVLVGIAWMIRRRKRASASTGG